MVSPGNEPVEGSRRTDFVVDNRRRRVRQKVHVSAYASFSGNSIGTVPERGQVVDASEDGACIQTSSPLAPDSILSLSLDLLETKAYVSTIGKVMWSDGRGRNGIHFPEMSEASRQQLRQWLFANTTSVGNDEDRAQAGVRPGEDPPSAIREHALQRPAKPDSSKREFVKQSPEQARAAIAASVKDIETSGPVVDYSALLTALLAVKREIDATGNDVDRALQLVADRALSLTRATGAALAVAMDADNQQMTCVARTGADAPGMGSRLQVGSGFSGECVRTGEVLLCDDTETDSRVDREGSRLLGIRSMVAAPIRRNGTVVGLLEVFSPYPHSFGANDQKILERLAEMTGGALDRRLAGVPAESGVQTGQTESATVETASEAGPIDIGGTVEFPPVASPVQRLVIGTLAVALLGGLVWLIIPGESGTPRKASRDGSSASLNPATAISPRNAEVSDLGKLRKLAANGDPNAQFDLGARYATGEDVKQDYAESVRWFTSAAEQGHVIAQATLGAYYWAGRGIPQDLKKAYFWSAVAQAGGDEASRYRMAVLASRMPHSQVTATQQQADEWLKAHRVSSKSEE